MIDQQQHDVEMFVLQFVSHSSFLELKTCLQARLNPSLEDDHSNTICVCDSSSPQFQHLNSLSCLSNLAKITLPLVRFDSLRMNESPNLHICQSFDHSLSLLLLLLPICAFSRCLGLNSSRSANLYRL